MAFVLTSSPRAELGRKRGRGHADIFASFPYLTNLTCFKQGFRVVKQVHLHVSVLRSFSYFQTVEFLILCEQTS